MKDKYLIIDGYNMIGQSPELGKIAKIICKKHETIIRCYSKL